MLLGSYGIPLFASPPSCLPSPRRMRKQLRRRMYLVVEPPQFSDGASFSGMREEWDLV